MPYLTGFLLYALLEGAEDASHIRLLERLPSDDDREMVRALLAVPKGERLARLDGLLAARNGEAEEIIQLIEVARSFGLAGGQAAIEKVFPTPACVSLDAAGDEIDATTWVWSPWIPRGYLTILAGPAGIGKSAVMLALVASATGARPWPDGSRAEPSPVDESNRVLWLDTEGSQAMLYERAKAQGLSGRIFWPLDPKQPDTMLPTWNLGNASHLEILAQTLADNRPRLCIIDSLSGAHHGDENSSDMRVMLQHVAELARDLNVPIIASHHLRKSGEGEEANVIRGIERMRGSSAIGQFARVVLALDAPNSDDMTQLRLRPIKNNLARLHPGLGASIEEGANVFFNTEAPEEPKRYTARGEAAAFLEEMLTRGPALAKVVKVESEDRALSWAAVTSAAKVLGVVKRKAGNRNCGWTWSLPQNPKSYPQGPDSPE